MHCSHSKGSRNIQLHPLCMPIFEIRHWSHLLRMKLIKRVTNINTSLTWKRYFHCPFLFLSQGFQFIASVNRQSAFQIGGLIYTS